MQFQNIGCGLLGREGEGGDRNVQSEVEYIFVGFSLEEKVVSSKHFIQVHLEILSCSVENIASQLQTKSITSSKSCQSSFTVKYYQ